MSRFDQERAAFITVPRRGPGTVALDLWRAGGTFRGFSEFAIIGAVVLAFLPGSGAGELYRQVKTHFDGTAPVVLKSKFPGVTAGADSKHAQEFKPVAAKPMVAPRIGDVEVRPAYFDAVEEPLRTHLVAAVAAYRQQDVAGLESALKDDSAEDGRVLLMRGLGMLTQGRPEMQTAGRDLLEHAFRNGEPRAAAVLGVLRMSGLAGYPKDLEAGRALLERAAAAGDAQAPLVLGEGYISGYSGAIDPAKATSNFRLASDRGNVAATFRLGELLLTGYGLPKNEAEGERLILKAAEAGYPRAQGTIGTIRIKAYLAMLTNDPNEALDWYEKAAAQGDARAMFNLGLFYMELGERVNRLDPPRAAAIFRQCAEATRNTSCVFGYATALDLGLGVTRDPVTAYALYSLVAAMGNRPKAVQRRNEIAPSLSEDDKKRASAIGNALLSRKSLAVAGPINIKKPESAFDPVPGAAPPAGQGPRRVEVRFHPVAPAH